jgi:hypothetical protein
MVLAYSANAKTWQVGPTRTYVKPSLVANLVADGDTVRIDPGLYAGDVCTWKANHLVLQGAGAIGQYAHLRADGQNAGGKAIWVIQGDFVIVDNIEFSLCQVPDHNGAGIRGEGLHLTVSHCYFHHNEMGILTTNADDAQYAIEYSEFAYNGYGDGFSHNVYVGSINSLIFRYNYSHHCKVGHLLKSRAQYNYIFYNRLTDEPGTDASREIDLPNGGTAVIIGNSIQQSAESQNGNIVGFGMEGLANNPPHALYMVNNTIVNERFAGRAVQFPAGLDEFRYKNNLFVGAGSVLDAGGMPVIMDTINNLVIPNIAAVGFVDYANFNYHLTGTAPGINLGTYAGMQSGFTLTPSAEYQHPLTWVIRTVEGILDIGAYEYHSMTALDVLQPDNQRLIVFPNPAGEQVQFQLPEIIENQTITLVLYDETGRLIRQQKSWVNAGDQYVLLDLDSTGKICFLQLQMEHGPVYTTKILRDQ